MKCRHCGSTHTHRRGSEWSYGRKVKRYHCQTEGCRKWFGVVPTEGGGFEYVNANNTRKGNKATGIAGVSAYQKPIDIASYDVPKEYKPVFKTFNTSARTWVLTSCINNTDTNTKFLETLKGYCSHNNAELLIIPLIHKRKDIDEMVWDSSLEQYFLEEDINLTFDLNILANMKVSPTSDPLSGVDNLTKGYSTIVGSPRIAMKTVANGHIEKPAIAYSTGTVSVARYSNTKAGTLANFNHSYSALVVEEDTSIQSFHIRVLNSNLEDGSFYDIGTYYSGNTVKTVTRIPAIVLGDEHVAQIDPDVKSATFTNRDSIVNMLQPEYLIRHDLLDFESRSHHSKDLFSTFAKYVNKRSSVEDELNMTLKYLIETTPSNSHSIIVDSNHNSHLDQWLNNGTAEIRYDPENMRIYFSLMNLKLESLERKENVGAFELWCRNLPLTHNIKFLKESDSFKLCGIELSYHADKGVNGSKGSAKQYSKLGRKCVVGHSHSPTIVQSCYVVGHSSLSKMGYNTGPSSWHQAHCLINPDGKRQIIFINQGKWRR